MEELLAQLLQQRALQTKAESDAQHGPVVAQLRAAKAKPRLGTRGNPVDPDASHIGTYQDDYRGERDRFPRVPAAMAPVVQAGDNAMTSQGRYGAPPPEYITSADERNYRKQFGYKGKSVDGPFEPLDLVTDASLNRDDDVAQTGWLPSDFTGMSHGAAAALIADQLRTRRIRTMQELDPEYLSKLPVY